MEDTAFYFAWSQFYNRWLLSPALLGLGVFAYNTVCWTTTLESFIEQKFSEDSMIMDSADHEDHFSDPGLIKNASALCSKTCCKWIVFGFVLYCDQRIIAMCHAVNCGNENAVSTDCSIWGEERMLFQKREWRGPSA